VEKTNAKTRKQNFRGVSSPCGSERHLCSVAYSDTTMNNIPWVNRKLREKIPAKERTCGNCKHRRLHNNMWVCGELLDRTGIVAVKLHIEGCTDDFTPSAKALEQYK